MNVYTLYMLWSEIFSPQNKPLLNRFSFYKYFIYYNRNTYCNYHTRYSTSDWGIHLYQYPIYYKSYYPYDNIYYWKIPLRKPKDAKYVPVKISAIETVAPNQIKPFSNIEVRLFIIILLCIFAFYIKGMVHRSTSLSKIKLILRYLTFWYYFLP